MSSDYHKGCQITLHSGSEAEQLLLRIRRRIEAEYGGAEIIIKEGVSPKKVEAGAVLVLHGHPLSAMGEVNQQGRLVRPMGGELILRHVVEIISEEENA